MHERLIGGEDRLPVCMPIICMACTFYIYLQVVLLMWIGERVFRYLGGFCCLNSNARLLNSLFCKLPKQMTW